MTLLRYINVLLLCACTLLFYAVPSYGQQGRMAGVEFLQQGDTQLVQISYQEDDAGQQPHIFALTEGSNRIVVDSPSVQGDLGDSPLAGQGAVLRIRHAMRGAGTRLVLDLAPEAKFVRSAHTRGMTQIFISGVAANTAAANGAVSMHSTPPRSIPRRVVQKSPLGIPFPRLKPSVGKTNRQTARKPVIIIDPGHGGYDPGAVGSGGTKEKVVTLAAAQQLQKQLLATGKYDVVLTRSKDVYVVHDERVKIARLKEADLFISIHADSLDKNTTRGASVYTLADYARKRSTRLVDSQNWIMDVDLSQENERVGDILVDLAQRKTFSNSDRFAEMLVPELAGVTKILGNTHRRAGLAVLLAPDVPAVLLEMGFLSNPQDEAALNSTAHRKKIMGAVVATIDSYFDGES